MPGTKMMRRLIQFAVWLTCLFAVQLCLAQPQYERQLFRIEKDGKSGFIDLTGKVVIPPQFDSVSGFSEGLALATRNGRKFFIDTNGKTAFEARFDIVNNFSEGLAAIKDGERGGFIDHTGKIIFEVPLDVTLGFHEGIAGVLHRGTLAYFD